MPRGGRRVGAGRKPKTERAKKAIVTGPWPALPSAPAPATEVVDGEEPTGLAAPPKDLSAAQQAIWREYAPKAIAQLTLVDATVGGFREFCERLARKNEIHARIDVLGATSQEADRLLKRYKDLTQLVGASQKEFKLTAFGKAEVAATKKPQAVNPWTKVGSR